MAATFLIDCKGIIRHIQLDGKYAKNSRDRNAKKQYEEVEIIIQTLIEEPPPDTLE